MRIREFGDFQTPLKLVQIILNIIGDIGNKWERVLEPTCGRGNFIRGILDYSLPPKEIIGIEIQDCYLNETRDLISTDKSDLRIIKDDIFRINLSKDLNWKSKGPLLVIGNPPWVTNSEIGLLNGNNLPSKSNFMKLKGIDAITGRSNFDIAEYILIKLMTEFSSQQTTIAFLCKTSVARKILIFAYKNKLPVSDFNIQVLDAKKWFNATVDACLLTFNLGISKPIYEANIYNSLEDIIPSDKIGFIDGHLISNIKDYNSVSFIEGRFPIEWRQGIKHDAASVMELTFDNSHWKNGFNEIVDIEDNYIYPLIKSSGIKSYTPLSINRGVIVTQRKTNEDTNCLKNLAPKLWNYLSKYKETFISRKSSIYKKKAIFSVFGVGKYSFSNYKVLVSGMYKEPYFIAVGLFGSKPICCDDTCYLLPCNSAIQVAVIVALLNHPLATKFIKSITFHGAKRPITKSVLQRIDIISLAQTIQISDLYDEIKLNLESLGINENIKNLIPKDLSSLLNNIVSIKNEQLMFTDFEIARSKYAL